MPGCQEVLNKCECWMEEEEGGREERVDGQVQEGNNAQEGQTDEEQRKKDYNKKKLKGERATERKGQEKRTTLIKTNKQWRQDTQWTEMEISGQF